MKYKSYKVNFKTERTDDGFGYNSYYPMFKAFSVFAENEESAIEQAQYQIRKFVDNKINAMCSQKSRSATNRDYVLENVEEIGVPKFKPNPKGKATQLKYAGCPAYPARLLDKLSKSTEYEDILWAIIKNPNTPMKTLEFLSNHYNSNIRSAVAEYSKHLDKSILTELANDKDYYVRHSVAGSSHATIDILEHLSRDENYRWVREAVVKNPNSSQDILIKMLEILLNEKDTDTIPKCNNNWDHEDLIESILKNPKMKDNKHNKLFHKIGKRIRKYIKL